MFCIIPLQMQLEIIALGSIFIYNFFKSNSKQIHKLIKYYPFPQKMINGKILLFDLKLKQHYHFFIYPYILYHVQIIKLLIDSEMI